MLMYVLATLPPDHGVQSRFGMWMMPVPVVVSRTYAFGGTSSVLRSIIWLSCKRSKDLASYQRKLSSNCHNQVFQHQHQHQLYWPSLPWGCYWIYHLVCEGKGCRLVRQPSLLKSSRKPLTQLLPMACPAAGSICHTMPNISELLQPWKTVFGLCLSQP